MGRCDTFDLRRFRSVMDELTAAQLAERFQMTRRAATALRKRLRREAT